MKRKSIFNLVAEISLFTVLLGFLTVQVFMPDKADATIGMMPFGGPITAYVPPIPFPPCPAHTVVYNYAGGGLAGVIGVYQLPTSEIYSYGNLFTPSNFVLGEYTPVPFVTCPTPYPVYPIFMVGTGAL